MLVPSLNFNLIASLPHGGRRGTGDAEIELSLSALMAVEKSGAVVEYSDPPHGHNTNWFQEQPFSRLSYTRWLLAYLGGDLTPWNAGRAIRRDIG